MHRIAFRPWVSLFLVALIGWPAIALANHHHIGGSGSGSSGDDGDADCVVWGYVVIDGGTADRADGADGAADAADSDAAASDGGNGADGGQSTDAAANDGGSGVPAGAVLVCLEHATLFGCDCATKPTARDGWPGAVGLVGAMLIARRRRRRDACAGGTP